MASSYFTESEAPRDFRVSSTESDGQYTKCHLCYTVKRNFYCTDCIKEGNFVHSSMPYSDRYSEKLSKLLRLKMNRKHILDRCERLLAPKLKKDSLLTEAKQCRDKIDLLKLAINQRRSNVDEKKKELSELKTYNTELRLRLPRYQKRVASLGTHSEKQKLELQHKINLYNEQADSLAALRRSWIRQLTTYIFPVYMSYDTSDSIEDMEFIGEDLQEPVGRAQLHIVAPSISTDGDYSDITLGPLNKEGSTTGVPDAADSTAAALGLAAQLLCMLAWMLHIRLPHSLSLSEYMTSRVESAEARAGPTALVTSAAASLASMWRGWTN